MKIDLQVNCEKCKGILGKMVVEKIPKKEVHFQCGKCGSPTTLAWNEDTLGVLIDAEVAEIVKKAEKGVF